MARNALQLAAHAYSTGDAELSNAALVLAMRWPRDRRAITLSKGGGVPAGFMALTNKAGNLRLTNKAGTLVLIGKVA